MEDDQSVVDHFEDDLSYMYDLDGDYSHAGADGGYTANRHSMYIDEEEGGETKALLMKVINEKYEAQEKINNEYEEKIKRLEEAISQLTDSHSTNRTSTNQSSFLNTKPMDVFEDDYRGNNNKTSTSFLHTGPLELFLEDEIINEGGSDKGNIETHPGRSNLELSKSTIVAHQKSANIVMGFNSLCQDTYNLMMLSKGFFCRDWQLGFIVFLFQLGLGILTLYSQVVSSESDFNDTLLQIPIHTDNLVKILQISSVIISVYYQGDVFNGIALPIDLRLNGPHPWGGIPIAKEEKNSKSAWIFRVLLPNLFKCTQGFVVLLTSLIVIVQSTNVIDLLKDFTSLYVISSIDNITFSVARRGFFGTKLLVKAARAEEIEISSIDISSQETQDGHRRWSNGTFIKTLVLHTILALSVSAWIFVVVLQGKGYMAKLKYPKCESAFPSFKSDWRLLENNVCNLLFNHPDCAYDGGDCSEFNLIYPGCEVEDISLLGNGICDGSPYDSNLCRFDGGDCPIENVIKAKYPLCEKAAPSFSTNWTLVENEKCDMIFNIPECGMDGGDCINFNLFYPACKEVKDFEKIDSARIGDGICDRHPYNAAECLFDGGDCRIDASYCSSSKKGTLGDGICDEELNVWECYFDRGDCLDSRSSSDVGDGICSFSYLDVLGSGEPYSYYGDPSYDGGDCIHPCYESCTFTSSHLNFVDEIGDEKCHNTWFHNKEECGWDGGDCVEFNKKYPNCKDSDLFLYSDYYENSDKNDDYFTNYEWKPENNPKAEAWRLGDGVCNPAFNTTECGFDEGDCCFDAEKDDNCDLKHNTEECGWDKGDCIEFNTKYPNCTVDNPIFLGDGSCDGEEYNTEECGWDGGDCIDFNSMYPNCTVFYPSYIGDNYCHSGSYNTKECGWEGGDCIDFNSMYPNCTVDYPSYLGDGLCNGGEYNTEECGWDGGDCIDLISMYPNCTVFYPSYLGNGFCDGGEYNTEECGWDGGDCIDFNSMYPNCTLVYPPYLGDGFCHGGEYNTEECGWDGGDCEAKNELFWSTYPNCTNVDFISYIGDNYCHSGSYNTEECGWDGGDCIDFNSMYPNCTVDYPSYLGDGFCNGGEYNTEECGWDGGDCIDFNKMYPNCTVDYLSYLGDGFCNGEEYNTEDCGWDGGDCEAENELFLSTYPNCTNVAFISYIGNGYCDSGSYNTEECGWDGGDCIDFNSMYPNCTVDYLSYLGDGLCDGGEYNTEECGWDGGDCI